MYEGKGRFIESSLVLTPERQDIGRRVVLKLTDTLPVGVSIFVDRYFTLKILIHALHSRKLYVTGTLMKNRIPKTDVTFKTDKHLRKSGRGSHDMLVNKDNKIAVTKWFDSKPIYMVSSAFGAEPLGLYFTQWLLEVQTLNKVQYVKSTGKRTVNKFEKQYYECRRSHRNRKEKHDLKMKRKRQLKSQGSCKLEKSCVSQIILKRNEESDECFITYYKSHYLHGEDIQHLQITKEDKDIIASKLILGVPAKAILTSTRDMIYKDLKRVDLLTNKDINNIKMSYKVSVKDGYFHHDDATSVDIWVAECKKNENNPVIFYKPQGQECIGFENDDFCLIIMNDVQRKTLLDFGNTLVTIDGTHGLNSYDFELTTLLVLDENKRGFPVAFMFSNKKNTAIYVTFFMEIKKITGKITSKVFMSDITDTYFNAWCFVMGSVEKRLLCSWHVDRAWQSNLLKIINKEKRSWVYKTLKYFQNLLNIDIFNLKFNEFVQTLLQDNDTKVFGKYIQTYYLPITKQWAYCHRIGCVNTNMHLESFHKTIKYHYLEGKKIKRLDKTINQLMLFIRDKTVERIIYLKKGKNLSKTEENDNIPEIETDISELSSQLGNTNNNSDNIKEKIKNNCLQIMERIEKDDKLSQEQLELMLKHSNTVIALASVKPINIFETSKDSLNEPANKKIMKQKSFCSTKKKEVS
ncbi:uncharacterized protein [Diabrotica undecimpunctata]|uniref:uncharacterized protein n=1 Tax=Diabrotica undecimpunctata TaxID=50387 RepID=UPI003B6423CF